MARFYEGTWQTLGGWERLMLGTLGGACRAVFAWTDTSGTLNLGFGTHQTLEVWVGGAQSVITPASGFTPGSIDGVGGSGYGAGTYGTGLYGEPTSGSFFPLTWSLSAFGQWLVACPRGQTIFLWQNNPATPAAALTNAPANVTYALSVPQRQIIAFGCNEEVSGIFNPLCIRWSDIENPTVWASLSSNNAGEYILSGGGRIVTARVIGDYLFIWTDVALYLGTFVGAPDQTWSFQRLGDHCGSISPGAPVVQSQLATWISPDAQFWACQLGGNPTVVPCPIHDDFKQNIALGQTDKIVGASTSVFQEIVFFYPDGRDGLENSRELRISPDGWMRGRLGRTAFVDSGPADSPVGVDFNGATGNVYWHEKGASADGSPLTGWIEGTAFYVADGPNSFKINACWPDFRDQVGNLSMTIFTRDYPQDADRTNGPWTLTPGLGRKSLRVSGRMARIRYDWSSLPASFRAGKQEFDVELIGGR